MALVLPLLENLGKDKHVESLRFPRLDEGSIPSSSTKRKKALIISELSFFLFSFLSSEHGSSGLTRRIM